MKIKKIAMISATSLILINTCNTLFNPTNTSTQTVLAAKKTKNKKSKNFNKMVLKQQKHFLYSKSYSGPKPNKKLEKLLKKFAKNAYYEDDDKNNYEIKFKAKRNTTCYYDATDYDHYDENGDPVEPDQLGTQTIKKGEIINLYVPSLQLTNKPFLGRNIFKNKVTLVGSTDSESENDSDIHYYYMDDFDTIK